MELIEILQYHARKFPAMEPVDAVKLLYQNEFGGGHMISDKRASLHRLQCEMMSIVPNEEIPLTEPIGNGMVRVNLAALPHNNIAVNMLNDLFAVSSQICCGNLNSFQNKLQLLKSIQNELHIFSFTNEQLSQFLRDYAESGYPAVSHSDTYRKMYVPAYRVVCEELLTQVLSR